MKKAIFVCDNADKAAAAAIVLKNNGYAAANITTEQVTGLLYDAAKFSDGVQDQFMTTRWVVTAHT